jgi:FlaG/FlaF family flagellin (archaellin)
MKRLLLVVAVLGLAGLLSAQQTPSTQTNTGAQQQANTQSQQQSAQSFEGTITKSGDKLVLQDTATQASYQLDDQAKAQQFEGKKVKVMATMDPNTNTLHVVEIAPSESH